MTATQTRLGFLAIVMLVGCYDDASQPDPIALETTELASRNDACTSRCAERSAQRYDECVARGNTRRQCGELVYDGWRGCNDACDEPVGCERDCEARGQQMLRACVRRGQSRARCTVMARRLVAQCTQQVCEERVDIPPCARDCRTRAYKSLRRCLHRGGHPSMCGRHAAAQAEACVRRTCEVPNCDEIRCPDGHHCTLDDDGPACVADPTPPSCDDVRCAEGTHCELTPEGPDCFDDPVLPTCDDVACPERHRCEMIDRQPTCIEDRHPTCEDVVCPERHHCEMIDRQPVCVENPRRTCDNVDCPEAHHCEMMDGAPVCAPNRVPSCEERCDRVAAQTYQHCIDGGGAPEDCRARAAHQAQACLDNCPQAPDSCDGVLCPDGHRCELIDERAVCVPDRVEPGCGNAVCPERHHCHETEHGPVCARDHGCDDTICPDGWSCEEIEGIAQCFGSEPTCLQLCYRRRDAHFYNCVHHDLRDADSCGEESDRLRAECANHCG